MTQIDKDIAVEKSDATVLTCIREFPCFTAWGIKFLEGIHFYRDPGVAYGPGGQEIFLPSRSSPR